MCGRYRFKSDLGELMERFPELRIAAPLTPRHNVAPTQLAPVGVLEPQGLALRMMRWGLVPAWSKDTRDAARCINARCETAATKPSFRAAFRDRRCLVIAHGYYEWQSTPHGKQPWLYGRKGEGLLCLAGLWEAWSPPGDPAAPALETFTILTTSPNSLAARLHDRMPVILPPDAWKPWLDPKAARADLERLLVPCDAADMTAWPVTPRMNSPRFESPDCLKPIELEGNLALE